MKQSNRVSHEMRKEKTRGSGSLHRYLHSATKYKHLGTYVDGKVSMDSPLGGWSKRRRRRGSTQFVAPCFKIIHPLLRVQSYFGFSRQNPKQKRGFCGSPIHRRSHLFVLSASSSTLLRVPSDRVESNNPWSSSPRFFAMAAGGLGSFSAIHLSFPVFCHQEKNNRPARPQWALFRTHVAEIIWCLLKTQSRHS